MNITAFLNYAKLLIVTVKFLRLPVVINFNFHPIHLMMLPQKSNLCQRDSSLLPQAGTTFRMTNHVWYVDV